MPTLVLMVVIFFYYCCSSLHQFDLEKFWRKLKSGAREILALTEVEFLLRDHVMRNNPRLSCVLLFVNVEAIFYIPFLFTCLLEPISIQDMLDTQNALPLSWTKPPNYDMQNWALYHVALPPVRSESISRFVRFVTMIASQCLYHTSSYDIDSYYFVTGKELDIQR